MQGYTGCIEGKKGKKEKEKQNPKHLTCVLVSKHTACGIL